MSDTSLIADLVLANHILSAQGIVDAMGHVSARHPECPDRFLLAQSVPPAEVTAADIMVHDLDGEVVGSRIGPSYLERFIHAEIYRAYPDAHAVVHSHSPAVIPFSVIDSPLRAIFHMSAFVGAAAPVFEIREAAGEDSDLLIRNAKLGRALANSFGDECLVLMRGHGSTVYGSSLKEAVFRAIYLEINANLQSRAMRLGAVNYLTPGEIRSATTLGKGAVERAWSYWLKSLKAV